MESQDVDGRIEWEAKRIAAAFGVVEFELSKKDNAVAFEGHAGTTLIWCNIDVRTQSFFSIEVGSGGCDLHLATIWPDDEKQEWRFYPRPRFHDIMVRGLYRLGFGDESVLAQLPPLSAHEQLELRLLMPREFWPKKWVDEEKAARSETL